jgi:HEPN domain-containing protein
MDISKKELETFSDMRLGEAKLLLDNGMYSGAYYIAGYCMEFALKACIAKHFRANVLPDKRLVQKLYVHDLSILLGLAGLSNDFDKESKRNDNFKSNWAIVQSWNEEARYSTWDVVNAKALLEAITDPKDGILQWLRKYY